MTGTSATYVYGVVAAGQDLSEQQDGIGGAPIRLVQGDGVAAIVSDLVDEEPQLGKAEMTAHARVLESLIASITVLPMRFGVVMADDADVRERLLDRHRDELVEQLARLDGRVQLSLRATYEEEPLMREIVGEEREIRQLHESLRGVSVDATYFERIRLGEMIAAAVDRRRQQDAEEIVRTLSPLAEAVELSEPRHERVVMGASFLVERNAVTAFDQAVDDVGRRQAGRMRLRYTGPLPPHSFVSLAEVS